MNSVGIGTTAAFANLVTPFSPVGKQAVGLENTEEKEKVLTPVEEPAKTSETFNRDTLELELPGQSDDAAEVAEADQQKQAKQDTAELERQEQQDQQLIRELAARDREVRAHEQAHAAVGGQFAGSPTFSFQRGPDGVNYAIGGEVSISLPSGGDDPRATLSAAEQVRRAALAPAEPSAQDQRVAAQASQLAIDARADIVRLDAQRQAEQAEQEEVEQSQSTDDIDNERQEEKRAEEAQARLEQQREESRRRAIELSDQLITFNNVETDQTVGAFIDQSA